MTDVPHTNRLIHETSPYLLQHAHNPVDWYPWGAEALARAKTLDQPIFLSIGYSTCYWCHVMERESFENPQIAALMNDRLVCIKVDREQRPDLDQLYMLAVQLMTRSGGWPMSVFLTPDGRPFYAGTYFPPQDVPGRPGFPTLIDAISDAWKDRRPEVEKAADSLIQTIAQLSVPGGSEHPLTIDTALVDRLLHRSIADFDPQFGGFGSAPKFPRQTLLLLLLSQLETSPRTKQEMRRVLQTTLQAMQRGGIRDQLGGGFHRYSTDAHWLIPHFEIMLYDNAMLLEVYARASVAFNRPDFARTAREIADFILAEMTGPAGEFFTAFDAEVDGHEGASYLWTPQDVAAVLSPEEAEVFENAYGLSNGPNFADPHHGIGEPTHNVLYQATPAPSPELDALRRKLLAARKLRKQPALDTKVLTSWNALMIRGFAIAGRLLGESRYVTAAARAADYLLQTHRTADGGLYRTSRDGQPQIAGFLDDYAGLADALQQLHAATGQSHWQTHAAELVQQMSQRFASPTGAFYFTDAGAGDALVRQAVAADSPLPSGNALAARVLVMGGDLAGTRGILAAFADTLDQQAEACSTLLEVAMTYLQQAGEIQVGPRGTGDTSMAAATRQGSILTATARKAADRHYQLTIRVADGFHINAPNAPAGLQPTRVGALAGGLPVPTHVIYPNATSRLPLPDGGEVEVYEGTIQIDLELETPPAGPVELTLEAQPCSDQACLEVTHLTLAAAP